MDHSDVAALVTYAASLDPGIVDDHWTVEAWADQLRGIAAEPEVARAAVRTVADRGPVTAACVRDELLPLAPSAARRWGTALVQPNPHESDYQRAVRRRRGLAKARAVLAQGPLPLEPDEDGDVTERERLLRQAAAHHKQHRADQEGNS